jgi:hypothetical protein
MYVSVTFYSGRKTGAEKGKYHCRDAWGISIMGIMRVFPCWVSFPVRRKRKAAPGVLGSLKEIRMARHQGFALSLSQSFGGARPSGFHHL